MLQWLTILVILGGCRRASDRARFAKQHDSAFGPAVDLEMPKPTCDSVSQGLFERVEMKQFFSLHEEWMLANIADQNKDFDQLIDDGKSLRGLGGISIKNRKYFSLVFTMLAMV